MFYHLIDFTQALGLLTVVLFTIYIIAHAITKWMDNRYWRIREQEVKESIIEIPLRCLSCKTQWKVVKGDKPRSCPNCGSYDITYTWSTDQIEMNAVWHLFLFTAKYARRRQTSTGLELADHFLDKMTIRAFNTALKCAKLKWRTLAT